MSEAFGQASSSSASCEYDPSMEWPGDEGESDTAGTSSTSFLRLVISQSSCLPTKHQIAILTGFPEVQIGRDKPPSNSYVPRIRLAEMPVSKVHATVYWDGHKKEWGIVDMGSKHGTFLDVHVPDLDPKSARPPNIRLSPPKVASLPRTVHHLDCISIGSTTFCIHIHEDGLACMECSLESSAANEIPLFSSAQKSKQPLNLQQPLPSLPAVNAKRSLAMLKNNLLRQHSQSSVSSSPQSYMDRAARRREMHGVAGAPGVQLPTATAAPVAKLATMEAHHKAPAVWPPVSGPPTPLPSSNVGHRLLSKMGWAPGTGLGLPSDGDDGGGGIVEPIQVNQQQGRAGLGVKRPASSMESDNWLESEKQKRFASIRNGL
ncbi:hypothetical protein FA15DRAFT_636270 [Coprinopsis marcescibilis]|uniref:G-patch domain-containing protein n=1 Tax=Coprinopsis marcescibilis TaxID=230819 RepID=A0A5C3L2I6_COPMA|nr:hypothetical protein FA15DRAFT_636270 [Coprinopsis marcescibilis]